MSIESDSEFFEVFKIGGVYHRKYDGLSDEADAFYNGTEYADWKGTGDDSEFGLSANEEDGELIRFAKDFDFADDDFCTGTVSERDGEGESLLPYDYEMDIADPLHLDEQIRAYADDLWEFVSVVGETILFKRPKQTDF